MYGDRGFGGQRGGFSPVKVGEELDVKVEAVGAKGDGIAKVKGFVLFIPGAKEGDEVRIKVTKVLRNVGFAEVVGEAQGDVSSEETSEEQTESEEPAEEESQESEDFGEEDSQDSEDFGEEEEEKKEE